MTENFINLERDLNIQVNEAQTSPNKLNIKRSSPGHITLKLSKAKKESLKWQEDKRKEACKFTRKTSVRLNGFLSRNLKGQERVA